MKRRLLPALTTTLVAMSLAACGGSESSSPVSTHGSAHPGPPPGDTSGNHDPQASGPAEVRGAHPGGIVRVLTHSGLTTTLDPAEAYQRDTLSIDSNLITRSLTQYQYDAATRRMVLVPDLATDLGRHNDDYTKWQFDIRPRVRFQDGEPVTAKTVAWGIQRCMDATTFPTGPCQNYAAVNFSGGASYRGPYTAPHQVFRSVRARGHLLTIFLDKPFPDMPYLAALPAMGPVPLGERSDPRKYRTHPLATGPYQIVSYQPGRRLVLTRNPTWDPRSDPARTQYPDGYDFEAGLSSHRIDRGLLADHGRAQTTLTYDDVSAADYPDWTRLAANRLTLGGDSCTTYLAPDNRTVTDPRVRRALSWAYPYQAVIHAEGEIPGVTIVPASTLIPPGVPGRVTHDVTAQRGFHSDPAKARALLRAAHSIGHPIRFLYTRDDPVSVRVKSALTRALTASGFTPSPEPTYIGTSLPLRRGASLGPKVDVHTITRCGDWPTGGQWLPPVYGSTHPARTGTLGSNLEAFSQPSVDRRIAAIRRLPLEQQAQQWNRLDAATMRRWFPVVPIAYGGVAMAHGSRIRGMYDDSVRGMPTWGQIWVAPPS